MGQPSQRMPIAGMGSGKCPDKRLTCYSATDMWVVEYIFIIIIVDEPIMAYRLIGNEGRENQPRINHGDQKSFHCFIHLSMVRSTVLEPDLSIHKSILSSSYNELSFLNKVSTADADCSEHLATIEEFICWGSIYQGGCTDESVGVGPRGLW